MFLYIFNSFAIYIAQFLVTFMCVSLLAFAECRPECGKMLGYLMGLAWFWPGWAYPFQIGMGCALARLNCFQPQCSLPSITNIVFQRNIYLIVFIFWQFYPRFVIFKFINLYLWQLVYMIQFFCAATINSQSGGFGLKGFCLCRALSILDECFLCYFCYVIYLTFNHD